MNVSAIIVTRGDHDLTPIFETIPAEWEIVVWDNSVPSVKVIGVCEFTLPSIQDLAVYGRYAAIDHASAPLIYVQDDDVVLPPESIEGLIEMWSAWAEHPGNPHGESLLASNMPAAFRHSFYEEHSLIGFGAVFHRDLPWMAFEQLTIDEAGGFGDFFRRTCDIVFTALTPRVLVDVPYENLPWAEDETRMYRQNGHVAERTRMLELVRKVRDGT